MLFFKKDVFVGLLSVSLFLVLVLFVSLFLYSRLRRLKLFGALKITPFKVTFVYFYYI